MTLSCCTLSTAYHDLPIHFCHSLGSVAPSDICPVNEGPLLLPSNLLSRLTATQWQRGAHPFPAMHEAFYHTLPSTVPTCGLLSGPGFLLSIQRWEFQQLPSSSAIPSLSSQPPTINPSAPSWIPWLCFMTPGPPPDWEGLKKKRSERSFVSFCALFYTTSSFGLKLGVTLAWYNPIALQLIVTNPAPGVLSIVSKGLFITCTKMKM